MISFCLQNISHGISVSSSMFLFDLEHTINRITLEIRCSGNWALTNPGSLDMCHI